MNEKLEAARMDSETFYIDENNFILNKKTGELTLINILDGELVTSLTEEDIKLYEKELSILTNKGILDEGVLDHYKKRYKAL